MEVRVLSSALAVALALIGSGCGGDGGAGGRPAAQKPDEPPLTSFLPPPPPGFRYAPAQNLDAEREFHAQLEGDFDTDEVETRNVYRGAKFVAGVIVLRTPRPLTEQQVAAKVQPDARTAPVPVTLAGKDAQVVADGRAQSVIDIAGRVVIVVAGEGAVVRRVAEPLVR